MRCLVRPLTLVAVLCVPSFACFEAPPDGNVFTTTLGDDVGTSSDTTTGDGDGDTTTGNANCGDEIVQAGEDCDLGSGNADNGVCTTSCHFAACGDGLVYTGFEECDDGNPANTDDCLSDCKLATCGDGNVQAGVEMCDDGNADETDGCTSICMSGNCGDGIVQVGEQCDDSNLETGDECPACQLAYCGDGYTQLGIEMCDDGNDLDNDECVSAFCSVGFCGDGYLMEGVEACDDTNVEEDGACPACQVAFCGDGFAQAGVEECDDADADNDNDCANDCTWNQCTSLGPRAPFNTLGLNTASGCWDGNPCAYDQYSWDPSHGQNFQAIDQAVSCTGAATCVSNVGINTYEGGGSVCQGAWDIYCDDYLVGQINTLGKACTGSAMNNTCKISFPGRVCTEIEVRAAMDNDANSGCCGGGSPDSMLTSVSAW